MKRRSRAVFSSPLLLEHLRENSLVGLVPTGGLQKALQDPVKDFHGRSVDLLATPDASFVVPALDRGRRGPKVVLRADQLLPYLLDVSLPGVAVVHEADLLVCGVEFATA